MMSLGATPNVYLAPAEYVDNHHRQIIAAAKGLVGEENAQPAQARRLFTFVRDIPYDAPDFDSLASFRASEVLAKGRGYCVVKASLFVALCRAVGIPARLGFADVTNHLATDRTLQLMGGNRFAWHGYGEVWLNGRWIKASPTFDPATCTKMGVATLEFDGMNDAHLQPFDAIGSRLMQYERFHGTFHDVPARFLCEEMPKLYPRAVAHIRSNSAG